MKAKFRNIFILLILLFLSVYYNSSLKESLLPFSDKIIASFLLLNDEIKAGIGKHFEQAKQINFLKEENIKLREKAELSNTFANELNSLLEDKKSLSFFPKLTLVKTLSYLQLNDYNKLWLDAPLYDGKIRGLVSMGYSYGIVVPKNGRPLALLQGDKKCIFSVYIGSKKIPGLAHGYNKNMIIKYIPRWMDFKIGEEVYTSGLDNIFFPGVLVGKVIKIIDLDAYKNAIIEPFAKENSPTYLYMIQSI